MREEILAADLGFAVTPFGERRPSEGRHLLKLAAEARGKRDDAYWKAINHLFDLLELVVKSNVQVVRAINNRPHL